MPRDLPTAPDSTRSKFWRKALPSSVSERFIDLNLAAFEKGYEYGVELLKKESGK